MTILALASVVNYDRQSDAPIWSATSRGVNYDRNKFIIQATGSFELERNGPEINLAHSWSTLIEIDLGLLIKAWFGWKLTKIC